MTELQPSRFQVTCAEGLESALIQELAGMDITATQIAPGRVGLPEATLEQAYRTVLWSRIASRVLMEVLVITPETARHDVRDIPEELYQAARQFDWPFIFDTTQSFAVETHLHRSLVANLQFANLRAKDGIADAFRDATGSRPSVDASAPDVLVHVFAGQDSHSFMVDIGGESLHKRGYRQSMTEAPLKENLASALLQMAGWPNKNFDALIDPMCGSGTFIIEALGAYYGYAPRLGKPVGSAGWKGHHPDTWEQLQTTANDQLQDALQNRPPVKIYAFDADTQAVKATHKNLLAAGLSRHLPQVQLEKRSLSQLPAALASHQNALLVTNPPYGERLGDRSTIRALYQGLGRQMSAALPAHKALVLGLIAEDLDVLKLKDAATARLRNGNLTVYARSGTIPDFQPVTSSLQDWQPNGELVFEHGQDFSNRLQKNLQQYKKLARQGNVTNLRIYDADLPDYNLAIDLYGSFLHVQEYAPPKTIEPEKAKERLNQALHIVRQVTGIPRERIFIKTRERQKGQNQYEKAGSGGKRHVVREGDAHLLVNFTDYLDTGLFLDHRPMRQRVADYSRNKKLLNLYAYTCTASVQAALAGAQTTSVDLSATYLDWGKSNYALNGLTVDHADGRHRFIEADAFSWLKEHQEMYDVIFIDPPTFSNSKKFSGTFDVQRDHLSLIKRGMNRLENDGVLLFSNNYRRFELDPELEERFDVTEITPQTIDFDYRRNPKIHRAWEVRHKKTA